MKKAPIIGIVPLIDCSKNSYWMLPGYFGGIIEAGGLPVMLPLTSENTHIEQITEMCSGFLFTGGQDVCPEIYSARKIGACGECSPERDAMETLLLKYAMQINKPILGICRGIQFINAALGGTLWQDIPSQFSDTVTHCQKPPYDVPSHEVYIDKGTPLHELLKKLELPVNSYHHQGIRLLSEELKTMMCYDRNVLKEIVLYFCESGLRPPGYKWIKDEVYYKNTETIIFLISSI